MANRKFTPPTTFPAKYINGDGERVTLLARARGNYSLIGQFDVGIGDEFVTYTEDGRYISSVDDPHPSNLHDLPKRITTWQNVYVGELSKQWSSREAANTYAYKSNRLCVHRIEYDEDGRNPEIFVEDV